MKREELENGHFDDLLSRSYEPLRQTNSSERQAVLAGLAAARASARPAPIRAWPRRVAWLAAACIVAAVTVKTLLIPSSTSMVYGLETVSRRLCDVQTIRITGSRYVYNPRATDEPPQRVPIVYLVKRPDKLHTKSWSVSQDGDKTIVRTATSVCDGRRQTFVSDSVKEYGSNPVNPIDARLQVELFAQAYLLSAVMGPFDAGYRKVGRETYHGRACDVYEARTEERGDDGDVSVEKIWFDPLAGYPIRLTSDEIQADGSARRDCEYDEIEVNVPLADELFTLKIPTGYKRVRSQDEQPGQETPLAIAPTGSGYSGNDNTKFEAWHAWRITDSAILITWRRSTPKPAVDGTLNWLDHIEFAEPETPKNGLTIIDAVPVERDAGRPAGGKLRHAWLYESRSPDIWNWSLVAISPGTFSEPAAVSLILTGDMSEHTMGWVGLRFPDEQLEQILSAAEAVALPPGVARFSLAEIRTRAEELVASKKNANSKDAAEKKSE